MSYLNAETWRESYTETSHTQTTIRMYEDGRVYVEVKRDGKVIAELKVPKE